MNKDILLFGLAALALCACSSVENESWPEYTDPGSQAGQTALYEGGNQMDDNYTEVSGWEDRDQWNLANVHDPSIMKAADGYYYMYQTDASYGNAHAGYGQYRGHFYCRRSKDLVNWQWMGPTMHGVPTWYEAKLNEYRHAMGLEDSPVDFGDSKNFLYWAPCVRKVSDNLYRMYYAVGVDGAHIIEHKNIKDDEGEWVPDTTWSDRGFIGLMETNDPSNVDSWVDKGYVTTCYSDKTAEYQDYKSAWKTNTETKETEISNYQLCYYKYNAIDPTFIITPEGKHWLIYGSWNSGFAAMELDPTTGKGIKEQGMPWEETRYAGVNEPGYGTRVFTRQSTNRWQPSEGPEVVYHDGYYYLFEANGQLAQAYYTTVVRSTSIDGPYYDLNGRNFSTTGGLRGVCARPILTAPYCFGDKDTEHGWVGISHCAVVYGGDAADGGATDNDNWYYCSQQRYPSLWTSINSANALMMGGVRRIIWTDEGWPMVLPERYADIATNFSFVDEAQTIKPTDPITASEIPGNWMNVTLSSVGDNDPDTGVDNRNLSTNMVFNIDGTISGGTFSGQHWSFDAASQTLTIGSYKMYLSREQNWEMPAGQRQPTIVYAGYGKVSSTWQTFWGKKTNVIKNVKQPDGSYKDVEY